MIEKRYWLVDSLTGRREFPVFPSEGSWRSKINGVDGARSHTLLVRDRRNTVPDPETWERILQPWRMRLVAEWDGVVKYAGWILGHKWRAATGRLAVSHADFRAIAARRALFGIGPVDLPDIVIAGRSLRGLMGEFAWYALVNGGYRWALRLVIDPADRFEAGGESETIQRSRFDTLENLMRGLHTRENGPEAHFYPRWSPVDGALEDVLRIGNPILETNTIEIIGGAPKTPLTDFGYQLDAENQLTGVWGVAQGAGEDTKVGLASNTAGSEVPYLDRYFPIKATAEQTVADEQARGILATYREPTKQYEFQIASDIAGAEIGTKIRVYYPGDELQRQGWIEGRVIALGHDIRDRFPTLEIQ